MKIGYCCGVFDLGHIGHIKFLKYAQSKCDMLIVGLIEDEAVKNMKGKNRPILKYIERLNWLYCLNIKGYIVPQKSFNPSMLLKYTKPDIFFKGEDQTHIDDLYAKENKIPIHYIPRTLGISTSEIIRRIKNDIVQ